MNKDWKRIMLTSLFLVGTAGAFGYWSVSEFNKALTGIDRREYPASVIKPVDSSAVMDSIVGTVSATTSSTSTSIQTEIVATSSTISTPTVVEKIDPKTFAFTYPSKSDVLYTGCTYGLKWASSTAVSSFDIWLVNADTVEKLKPIKSGLIGTSTNNFVGMLPWTVGAIDSGIYYIFVSKIDNTDVVYRTDKFLIRQNNNISSSTDVCAR